MTQPTISSPPPEFIALAHKLADRVRPIIKAHFRTGLAVEAKGDSSPVTIADRKAEEAMRLMITNAFPNHGIRGEEYGSENSDAEWCWILDPIDGTKSFVSGSLCFGTQIGLTCNGIPVLGIIDQPVTEERWLGVAGKPTLLNGAPIFTSVVSDLAHAVIYTSAPEQIAPDQRAAFTALCQAGNFVRYSHDCYAAGLLALGTVDVVVEANLYDYDIVPQVAIIEGAGGVVSDWDGNKLDRGPKFKSVVMAANSKVHSLVLDALHSSAG